MPNYDSGQNKIPSSEELAETTDIMLASDVLSAADLVDYPKLKNESPRNQAVMCAYACGYGQRFIAKMFGIKQPTVNVLINRIDPNKMFKVSADSKKAFLTRIAESRAVEAISSITPEKLEDASAKELTAIAKDCVAISQGLNQSKHKELTASRLDSLIDSAIEADVKISESPIKE